MPTRPPENRELHPARVRALRRRLASWYAEERRELPWRADRDPYKVWVSEVMLQQTTVATVGPYWQRFVERFPDVVSLACASEEDVLRLWSGLGYYGRARRLLEAARRVVKDHGGRMPRSVDELRALPGIGPYTAAAIASIVAGAAVAVVDGNVTRVLARLAGIGEPPDRQPARSRIARLATELVDPDEPGDHNQALMELGATTCTPRKPTCGSCPWKRFCVAREEGAVKRIPAPTSKPEIELVVEAVALVRTREGRVLLRRVPAGRPNEGLLELPSVTLARGRTIGRAPGALTPALARRIEERFRAELGLELRARRLAIREKHAITRHRITALVIESDPGGTMPRRAPWSRVAPGLLGKHAITGLTRKIARSLDLS